LGDFLDLGHVITELLKIQKRFGADLEFDNIVEDTRDGHIFVLKGDPEGDYLLFCACEPEEPKSSPKKQHLKIVR
jgi:hypothetical protein